MNKMKSILKKDIKDLKPVYLLYGDDYLLQEFKKEFLKKHVDEGSMSFDYTYLEEEEEFAKKLKNFAGTPPVLSERRIIIARTGEYFIKKGKDDELLIKFFKNFPETTVLIIFVEAKIDGRIKIVRELKKIGEVIEAQAPEYKKLSEWIKREFQKRDKVVDHKSINLLEQMFKNNLQRLKNEIEKISLYFADEEEINYEKMLEVISKDRLLEDNLIFSLTDAIIENRKNQALEILYDMLKNGVVPLQILATIVWQFKLLLSVKALKEKAKTPQEIAKILGSHPYPVKKAYSRCSKFSSEELEKILEVFLEANINIVTGKYDADFALELAVVKL